MSTLQIKNLSIGKLFMTAAIVCFTVISTFAQDAVARTAAGAYNEGLALLKAKDYEKGLTVLDEALTLAEAEENEKVIKLAKKNGSKACYNLAKGKYKAKDYTAAADLYKKGMELDADNASNYGGLANVLKKEKKSGEAVDMYLKAAAMYEAAAKPKKIESMVNKVNFIVGTSYTDKNFDEAIELGKKALAVGENASIAYYVSRSMLEKEDHAGALEMATKAIATAGTEVEDKYYIALAMANVGLGKKADAIKAYEKVTEEKYLEQAKYQIEQLKG